MQRKWLLFFTLLMFLTSASSMDSRITFSISKTWDGWPVGHGYSDITLYPENDHVIMQIRAPFFNDPPAPNGEAGKPFPKLWEYEVVEAFFLGDDDKYLEVEFSPHGQHLLLLLNGRKNAIKMCLPVEYQSNISSNGYWYGTAKIPKSYFPPRVTLINAYAIHGSNEARVYEALFPVPAGHFPHPDFHRLEFFRYVSELKILRLGESLSEVWIKAIQEKANGKELSCEDIKTSNK